eukprot:SAG31_NODE_4614_length_3095_cov_76.629172_3_plen_327_part_00
MPQNLAAMVGELVPKSGVTQKGFRRDCPILRAGDDILQFGMADVANLFPDHQKFHVNSLQAKILKSMDAKLRGANKQRMSKMLKPCDYGCLCLHFWQRPEVEALETRKRFEKDLQDAQARQRQSKDVHSEAGKVDDLLQRRVDAMNVRIDTLKIYRHDDPDGHPDEIINLDNAIPPLKIFEHYIAGLPDPVRPVREVVTKFDLNTIIQESKNHTPNKAYVDIVQQWHARFRARNRKRRQMQRVGRDLRAQKQHVQRRFGGRTSATYTDSCRRMLPQLTEVGAPGNLIQQAEYARFNANQPVTTGDEPRCGRGHLGLFARCSRGSRC